MRGNLIFSNDATASLDKLPGKRQVLVDRDLDVVEHIPQRNQPINLLAFADTEVIKG